MSWFLETYRELSGLMEATAFRGLSKAELKELMAELKSKFGPLRAKYWTTPKHATGQVTLKPYRRDQDAWGEDLDRWVRLVDHLIAWGAFSPTVSLEKQRGEPGVWGNQFPLAGLTFYRRA